MIAQLFGLRRTGGMPPQFQLQLLPEAPMLAFRPCCVGSLPTVFLRSLPARLPPTICSRQEASRAPFRMCRRERESGPRPQGQLRHSKLRLQSLPKAPKLALRQGYGGWLSPMVLRRALARLSPTICLRQTTSRALFGMCRYESVSEPNPQGQPRRPNTPPPHRSWQARQAAAWPGREERICHEVADTMWNSGGKQAVVERRGGKGPERQRARPTTSFCPRRCGTTSGICNGVVVCSWSLMTRICGRVCLPAVGMRGGAARL